MGKPELPLDTEWVCVIVGRLQVGPPFRRTLSSQSRRLSCRGRRPVRTTRDQKEPPGTNEPWTFRDYPIIAEVLGLEENMSKTQSGVKIQSKSQSQSTKLMMMYLVLAVVILNYFLYPLIITFRENLDRGVFYFSRWTGGGFPPSPWAATSQKGVGDPELVRLFHLVLSHYFWGIQNWWDFFILFCHIFLGDQSWWDFL